MKKIDLLLGWLFSAAFLFTLTSCESDDQPVVVEVPEQTEGVFVLNRGNHKENNASISYFDTESKTVVSDLFSTLNGRKLGDSAQELLIYGGKMYVTVSGSYQIEVMDKKGNSLKTITSKNTDNSFHQPRCMASGNGKVYVTFFDGYVGIVDTTSLEVTKIVPVGLNPEQLTLANNKIYVAVSEGINYPDAGTKVAVLDASTLAEVTKIDVLKNPTEILSDSQGDVYVISMGDYGKTVKNTLQRIDKQTQKATALMEATTMTIENDTLYAIYSPYYNKPEINHIKYDCKNESLVTKNFLTEDFKYPAGLSPSCLKIDPVTRNIYIGIGVYGTKSDMYIFTPEGKQLHKFEVGLDPKAIAFISNK